MLCGFSIVTKVNPQFCLVVTQHVYSLGYQDTFYLCPFRIICENVFFFLFKERCIFLKNLLPWPVSQFIPRSNCPPLSVSFVHFVRISIHLHWPPTAVYYCSIACQRGLSEGPNMSWGPSTVSGSRGVPSSSVVTVTA